MNTILTFNMRQACLHGLTAFTFFLLAAHGGYAQYYPVNPNFNPLVPDYYELETCGSPNNAVPSPGQCPEPLSFPTISTPYVIEGKYDTIINYPGFTTIDTYKFVLDEATNVRFSTIVEHAIPYYLSIQSVPDSLFNCQLGFDDNFYQVNVIHNLFNTVYLDQTYTTTLPAGKYFLVYYVDWMFNNIQPKICESTTYQIVVENLDAYGPGQTCELAREITPAEVFNDSRLQDNMNNGLYFGDFGCAANDVGQAERWFKFTAAKTTSFIQALRTGSGNFDGAIEVYTGCSSASIACQNSTGSNEILILPTNVGQEYWFRIYHNGAQALGNTAFSAAVAYVPPTKLRILDCDRMDLTVGDIIRSDWPSNAFLLNQWQFKFEEQEAPFNTYEITSPNGSNPQFRMSWFPQMQANRTYKVWTRPRMYQGPTWGDYADWCLIGTAPTAGIVMQNSPPDEMQGSLSAGTFNADLWPNPAGQSFNLGFQANEGDTYAELSIFDLSGKRVEFSQVPISQDANYVTLVRNTDRLSTGLYLVQVRTASGQAIIKLSVNK
jgi:hypothetical protein